MEYNGKIAGKIVTPISKRKFSLVLLLVLLVISPAFDVIKGQSGIFSSVAHCYTQEYYTVTGNTTLAVTDYFENSMFGTHIGIVYPGFEMSYNCLLKGLVHTSNGLLNSGVIYILDTMTGRAVDSASIRNGKFSVKLNYIGEIILLAVPDSINSPEYIPTYYVGSSTTESSHKIFISKEKSEIGDLDIQLLSISEIQKSGEQNLYVDIFPNPVQDVLHLNMRSHNKLGELNCEIINVSGHHELITHHFINNPLTSVALDLKDLKPGFYVLRITLEKRPPINHQFYKYK